MLTGRGFAKYCEVLIPNFVTDAKAGGQLTLRHDVSLSGFPPLRG